MKYITLVLMAMLLFSCSEKSFDRKEDLVDYIKEPDNGYYQTKEINGLKVSAMYRPADLLVAQELEGNYQRGKVSELRDRYDDYLYFNLSLSKYGNELLSTVPGNRSEFGAMVGTLAFGMDQNVHLFTSKKDTIPMVDYIYPRMYNMSNTTSILLVYPKTDEIMNDETFTLSVSDFGLRSGEINFKFSTDILKNEPTLSFK